ncbi:cell envelope integrity protein CreD [Hyphobacterium sp.]|uniref:cell envelope integrity protein CreD n=1 Tax=Hyphobacterium sp. TaxID=2004662 RepID=UPI003BAB6D9E
MAQSPLAARSLGLKLLAVGFIVILLAVPLLFVSILSWERAGRADEVRAEVGEAYGGPQLVRGPFLVLPVQIETPVEIREDGQTRTEIRRSTEHIILSADQLQVDIAQASTLRRRAIYDVPVFDAAIQMEGRFALPPLGNLTPQYGTIDWSGAEIVFAISDLRGIGEDLVFETGMGQRLRFEPQTVFDRLSPHAVIDSNNAGDAQAGRWQGVAAGLDRLAPEAGFDFTASLQLSGADLLLVAASGRETQVSLQSDWPHPSFLGAYLPQTRDISDGGHAASWQVPYLARGVPGVWRQSQFDIRNVDRTAFGVRLFSPADGYTNVGRSLKYAIFFIGFLMLMFFLIEAATRDRIHAAQYLLIGVTQVIFYLLLLAFSEHMATFTAYLTASAATITLTALYAAAAFKNRTKGMAVFGVLSVIYAMQYALVLLEDYALLMGAVLAFLAMAITMYVTRRLDWYALGPATAKT